MEDIIAACAIDLAAARDAYVLAQMTLDIDLEKRAVAKYMALVDVLESVGLTIALIPAL